MKANTSTSQKIGVAIFIIGAIYMFGLGWLYSWKMVPAVNQYGAEAMNGWFGLLWALSVPMGCFIVAIGAALTARAERRLIGFLSLLLVLCVVWQIVGTTRHMIPALFGIDGGLITLFFIGITWQWASIRPTLSGTAKTGSDLRMIGFIFFVMTAWQLCGIFGIARFVLRPDLADKFSVPISATIDSASQISILLALGWGFNYFGQLLSHPTRAAETNVKKVSETATAD